MQKYFITDGKRYVKFSKGRYTFCTSPVMANTFPLKKAQNILENSLQKNIKSTFYLEGEDDFVVIKQEVLDTDAVKDVLSERFILDVSALDKIRECTNKILDVQIPSREQLLKMKKYLEDAQQFYDNACSDIRHWVLNHEPPAHIRTKVYGIQHTCEQERANVKEVHNFVVKLIEGDEKKTSLYQLQQSLKSKVYVQYTPNTYIYKTLDDLMN